MTAFVGPPADTEEGIGPLTFGEFLDEIAARHGTRPAYVWVPPDRGRVEWSYDELREQARSVAKGLLAGGVGRGTRVAVLLATRPEWVASVWGAAMAGGVPVLLNTFAEPRELDYLLLHSDAEIVLTQRSLLRHRYVDDLVELCPELLSAEPGAVRSPRYPFLRAAVALDAARGELKGVVQGWSDFLSAGADVDDAVLDAAIAATDPSDDGLVIYSSGTTALPKGVLHRHRGPLVQSWRHARREEFTPDDRIYSGLPFFWTAGFAAALGATLASGACLVTSSHFDAEHVLSLIESEGVTVIHGPANQDAELRAVQARRPRDLSAVRREVFRVTGEPEPAGWTRPTSRAAYGSSETFTSATALSESAPIQERATSGRLTAGTSMRIVDPLSGFDLGVGEQGEVLVRGLTMMRGYLKVAPELCFDPDGWFHTGDLGWFDEDGLFHFAGRATNIIKTSGANVAPLEVEQLLLAQPDLDRAVVVGAPDEVAGEIVVACVVPSPGATVTEDLVRERLRGELSAFKIPRRVLVFGSVDELPQTGSDKFNIPAVRALVVELLGHAGQPTPTT